MGQQQLLLVILVTIIVGIATVVAINTFGSASDSANVDAVRGDLLSIAAASQQYYIKPTALGGGSQTFTGMTTNNLGGVPGDKIDATTIRNENGEYTIPGTPGAAEFIVTGVPATADGGNGSIQIRVCADNAVMGDYDPTGSGIAPGACPTS